MTILPPCIPYVVKACKREDGLIEYVLMSPHVLIYTPGCAARDEEQIRGRVQHLLPVWQESVSVDYVTAERLEKMKLSRRLFY